MSMENALGLTGRQITRFHAPPYRADNGNLGNFEALDHNGTVFALKQRLFHKVAVRMESLKVQLLCRCNKRNLISGPANHPVSCTAV